MEKPREVYLQGCAILAEHLGAHGFRYRHSKRQEARRTRGDFVHEVAFQSSHGNIAGERVALWIHASVASPRLRAWRLAQVDAFCTTEHVAGGQIGNLTESGWLDLDLGDPRTRDEVLARAVGVIDDVALPYFALFDDVAALADRLTRRELRCMDAPRAVEFLLCFASRDHAVAYLTRHVAEQREQLRGYEEEVARMLRDGVPEYSPTKPGEALAKVTVAHGLPLIV